MGWSCDMKSIDKSWKQLIKEQIEYCADECSANNWDGDGGIAVAPASKEAALLFVDLLPDEMIAPDVGPENTGHFSFDWNPCDGSVISVSVLPGRAIFASIMGSVERNSCRQHGELGPIKCGLRTRRLYCEGQDRRGREARLYY